MDGYAVVASSSRTGERLRVIGEQPAGLERQLRISLAKRFGFSLGLPTPCCADAGRHAGRRNTR